MICPRQTLFCELFDYILSHQRKVYKNRHSKNAVPVNCFMRPARKLFQCYIAKRKLSFRTPPVSIADRCRRRNLQLYCTTFGDLSVSGADVRDDSLYFKCKETLEGLVLQEFYYRFCNHMIFHLEHIYIKAGDGAGEFAAVLWHGA